MRQVTMRPASSGDGGQSSDGVRGPRRRFQAPSPYVQIYAAIATAIARRGYKKATVKWICSLAGIPIELFQAHFKSKQQAVLETVEEFADRVIGDCTVAFEKAADNNWPWQIWAVSTVLTDWGACEPYLAYLAIVGMRDAGKPAQELMDELLDTFARFLQPGYEQFASKGLKQGSLDKEIGGQLLALLREHLQRRPRHSRSPARTLPSIAPDLARIALAPFIGEAEAERFVAERLAEEQQ
jgi:AcrR family transcriptional regulator